MGDLLRIKEVERLAGLSRAAIYAAMQRNEFPRPVKVGKRAVRWRSEDFENWRKSRPAAE